MMIQEGTVGTIIYLEPITDVKNTEEKNTVLDT